MGSISQLNYFISGSAKHKCQNPSRYS